MSLVINRKKVIVEDDAQFVDCFDKEFICCGARDSLKHISTVSEVGEASAEEGGKLRRATSLAVSHDLGESTKIMEKESERGGSRQKLQLPPNSRRRFDFRAVSRLVRSTVASRARSQKKHSDVLEDIKKHEMPSASRSVSPVATKAGLRLYNSALAMRKRLDKMRAEQEEKKRQNEKKFSFRPHITVLAKEMASGGYKPPHERYSSFKKKRLDDFLLREKEKLNRMTAGCTFHPTLTAASEQMVRTRRSNEPFNDVGNRLFYEGGCRLIRQQLRERILEQKAENDVIGAFQITQESAGRLASRLMKWKEISERNIEAARQEHIQSVTRSARESKYNVQSQQQKSSMDRNDYYHSSRRSSFSARTGTGQLEDSESFCVRCCSLFYKYAALEGSEYVQLHDIKRHVRDLFPEDFAVVEALAKKFSDFKSISKSEFVDALLEFRSLHESERCDYFRRGVEPSLLSRSPALARTPREFAAEGKEEPQRSSSAYAKLQRVENPNLMRPNLLRCRTVCANACEQPSRGAGSSKAPQETTAPQSRKDAAEISGAAELCAPRRSSGVHDLPVRSQSLGSVELSSLTDDYSNTPIEKRQEEIVAELEALLSTPTQRSATASPIQENGKRGVSFGKCVSKATSGLQRRRVRKIRAPTPDRAGCDSYAETPKGCTSQTQLSKGVQSMLNSKNLCVELDSTCTGYDRFV